MKDHQLFICNSCRFSAEERVNSNNISGGLLLYIALKEALARRPKLAEAIELREFSCLMSCEQHCNVHLRHPDKIGYILGRWTPEEESAEAILDYAEEYLNAESGQVPFRQWPQSIKGHFIARVPPASE